DEVEATSTNNEIFVVPISGGTAKKISTSPGADTTPLYSPDGKYLAWRSQARAGFEADKWRLFVQDRQSGKITEMAKRFEYSIGSFSWTSRPGEILYTAEKHGSSPVFATSVGADWTTLGKLEPLHADDLIFASDFLYYTKMSTEAPNEIWRVHLADGPDEEGQQVTHINDALLSQIDMQPLESFKFKGANDNDVQGFMVKPPGFDPNKKYPLKFLIHGGPQGAWGNEWTYRWNAELFAASGNYV